MFSFLPLSTQLAGLLLVLWAGWHVPTLERDTGKFTNPIPGAQGDRDGGEVSFNIFQIALDLTYFYVVKKKYL